MKMTRSGLAVLFVFLMAAGGCAGRAMEPTLSPEQYVEVARTFEADSTLHVQERALYLAGLAYALPESPAYDPRRAMQIFDRLIALYPDSPGAVHAAHLQQLHRALGQSEEALGRLEREVASREAALATAREESRAIEEQLAVERARGDGLQVVVDRLTGELQRANARIGAIEAELEALKGIDLNRPRS